MSAEQVRTTTRAESLGEAIDLFVEANYSPEKHNFQPLKESAIKVSIYDDLGDGIRIKSDLVISFNYELGHYRLASTQTEIRGDDSRRLLESQEFFFFQDKSRCGLIQLTVTDHYNGLPVCALYSLEGIEENYPNAYKQYRFGLLTMLTLIATACHDYDLFDPYVAKVRCLVNQTVEKESQAEFWKTIDRIIHKVGAGKQLS